MVEPVGRALRSGIARERKSFCHIVGRPGRVAVMRYPLPHNWDARTAVFGARYWGAFCSVRAPSRERESVSRAFAQRFGEECGGAFGESSAHPRSGEVTNG